MRAVVFQGIDRVTVERLPDPVPQADTDAVVRVRLAGVCGTDLHVTGPHGTGMTAGTVLGHEFVGEVVAVGAAVRRVRVGSSVLGSDFTACGACWWCDRGEHWHCTQRQFFGTGTGFGPALAGAQTELVRVPYADTTLAVLPHGVSDAAALLVGDNLATGWVAIERAGVRPGDTVAVIGGGPVGLLTSLCAQTVGAVAVVVADPVAERRDFAKAHGAVPAEPGELRSLLEDLTEGRGADAVVECVGAPVGLEAALAAVRNRGTVVAVGAHTTPSWPLALADAFAREVTLGFAIGDPIRSRGRLLPLVAGGLLDPTFVVDGTLPLDAAPDAYARMRSRTAMKLLLDPR